MVRADVIYLVAETPSGHGVFDKPIHTERMVYCTVRSVGYNEYYRAHEQGLEPSVIFALADYADYDGERLVRWGEKATTDGLDWAQYYRIIRTYSDGKGIELTCEEAEAYAATDD